MKVLVKKEYLGYCCFVNYFNLDTRQGDLYTGCCNKVENREDFMKKIQYNNWVCPFCNKKFYPIELREINKKHENNSSLGGREETTSARDKEKNSSS